MEEPGFWDDPDKSQEAMKELKNLKDTVDKYHKLEQAYEDVETMIEMGYEENDESLVPEIEEMLNSFIEEFEALKISTLLSGEYDANNAILTLHAGAGGTEACDWTFPYVQPVGGAAWLFHRSAGLSGRRRSRDQECDASDQRGKRLRLSEV